MFPSVCEIDGRVLGGMQFGVLVGVLFCEIAIDGQGARRHVCCWRRCCIGGLLAAVLTRMYGRQGAVWGTLRHAVGESGDGAGACWRN